MAPYLPNRKKRKQLKTPVRYPYHIRLKLEQDYFYMAGLWQKWTDQNTGESVDTGAIITVSANELMAQVHNIQKRMTAILNEELAAEWISDGLSEKRITEIATTRISARDMIAYSVQDAPLKVEDPTAQFTHAGLPELELIS